MGKPNASDSFRLSLVEVLHRGKGFKNQEEEIFSLQIESKYVLFICALFS